MALYLTHHVIISKKIIQFTVAQFLIDLTRLLEEGMLPGKAISRISEKLFFV